MNRRTFQQLALTRLQDVRALLKARRYDAAYYFTGYVIEWIPPDLPSRFENQLAADARLAEYWSVVKDWSEESRYDASGLKAAKELLEAVSDPGHGVLQCLQKDW